MIEIPQVTEIGIIAGTGAVNLFLAFVMMSLSREKGIEKNKAEEKETKPSETRNRKKKKLQKKEIRKSEEELAEEFPEESFHQGKPVREDEAPKSGNKIATLSLIKRDEGLKFSIVRINDILSKEGEYRIGSRKTSNYVVQNQYVSGVHAVISQRNGRYYIKDVSRNGTQLSTVPYESPGQNPMLYKIEPDKEEELSDGTIISLAGKAELIFNIIG